MDAHTNQFQKTDPAAATHDRILDIAEALFATHGIQGTSIRHITDRAGVNVAAVNYHFGSKDKLVAAVIDRRFQDLEDERSMALDRLEARHLSEGQAPNLEELAAVLVTPAFRHLRSGHPGWLNFIRVLARLTWEPGAERFAPPPSSLRIFDRFDALLKLAVPALAGDDARRSWRLAFLRGASQQTMLTIAILRDGKAPNAIAFAGALNQLPEDEVETELIRFVTAGLAS
jgi:AcrR family transcriptional regulator